MLLQQKSEKLLLSGVRTHRSVLEMSPMDTVCFPLSHLPESMLETNRGHPEKKFGTFPGSANNDTMTVMRRMTITDLDVAFAQIFLVAPSPGWICR